MIVYGVSRTIQVSLSPPPCGATVPLMTISPDVVVRVDPPTVADERTSLLAWLDHHRATLLQKYAGLDGEQLTRRAVPPSMLSLAGLLRHLTDVEHSWLS